MSDLTTPPAKPLAIKRQPDLSPFANANSGILLHFEDPALALVRNAANAVFQPANNFELLLAEQIVRNFRRAMRNGILETAAIDVERSERQETIETRWGKLDPESLYHLATREPATPSSIREYAPVEAAAMRRLKEAVHILKTTKRSS